VLEDPQNLPGLFNEIHTDLEPLTVELKRFQEDSRQKSELFTFCNDYIAMVTTRLQFIKAERSADWTLHLATVAAMAPHFNSMDRSNYARWLPVHLGDMTRLPETYPEVHM